MSAARPQGPTRDGGSAAANHAAADHGPEVAAAPAAWPTVSVIVPVYNGGAGLAALAASLRAQDYPGPPPELIFVDNGSSDDGMAALARLPVSCLAERKPGGPAARNRGARAARGEVLCFIDQDCTAERRWLRRLVAPFQDPAVSAAAGETLTAPGASPVARYLALIRQNSAELSLQRPVFPFAPLNNLAVRRARFEALGGLDETLTVTDDADFCLRLLRQGDAPIRFVPCAIVFHAPRTTTAQLFAQYRKYGRGWADLVIRHPTELRWTPWHGVRADLDALGAAWRVLPAGLARLLGRGQAMDFHFRRLECVRRCAHRMGFVERAVRRGRWLW